MTIYLVDAEDLMNSTMSNNRETIGYFTKRSDAVRAADIYNADLSPALRKSSFKAIITPIKVQE